MDQYTLPSACRRSLQFLAHEGKAYKGVIVGMAECVFYKQSMKVLAQMETRWSSAVWLRKNSISDEHVLGVGAEHISARTIRREPIEDRYDKALFEAMTATP